MECCLDVTGQPITCSKKEALDWFNKGLTEYVLVRDPFIPLFTKALQLEDDSLVIVHCLLVVLRLVSLHSPTDPNVSPHLKAIKTVAASSSHYDRLSEREKAYVQSTLAFASGNPDQATSELCTMLYDHPGDLLAVRVANDIFVAFGEHEKNRDMIARALPFWTDDMPLYHGLLATYGFALEECKERERSEMVCRRALSMDKRTPFATHALAHVLEESHDPSKGVEFLTSTRSDWSGVFEGHITWHLLLYYLDLGEVDKIWMEFDSCLKQRATKDNVKGLFDASSLLWRLEVMGIDPGEERWQVVTDAMIHHVHNHRSPWYNAHIMFGLARGRVCESTARLALAERMIRSMEEYAASKVEGLPNQRATETLGVPVCNALLAFGKGQFDEVLQIMLPLRHNFISFGGSWAQRQVFNVTMIQAAIKANKISVAMGLVAEMMGHKPNNPGYIKLFEELKKQ